jgi:hypothetical protein
MQTQRNPSGLLKSTVLAFICLFGVPALLIQPQAAEQPQPGPEHKKLEVWVGEWTYEGTGEVNPFSASSGRFKGKISARMALGGFFVHGQSEDLADDGYRWQGIWLVGYDPANKAYLFHSYENDGAVSKNTSEVVGNTWTTIGTQTDRHGTIYRTRMVNVFSADGKTSTELMEYSADDGKTWATAYRAKMTRVSK